MDIIQSRFIFFDYQSAIVTAFEHLSIRAHLHVHFAVLPVGFTPLHYWISWHWSMPIVTGPYNMCSDRSSVYVRHLGWLPATNLKDLCHSSHHDDVSFLLLFSIMLSTWWLFVLLLLYQCIALPRDQCPSFECHLGVFRSIDIDGFVTRTNWFWMASKYPAMWKKKYQLNARDHKWKGNSTWKGCEVYLIRLCL